MRELGRDLDLAQEPLGAEGDGELGSQHLERHGAAELAVVGEVDRGHPALAQLALDRVAIGERGGQAGDVVRQKLISTPSRAAIGAWYAMGCLYCGFGEAGLPFWSSVVNCISSTRVARRGLPTCSTSSTMRLPGPAPEGQRVGQPEINVPQGRRATGAAARDLERGAESAVAGTCREFVDRRAGLRGEERPRLKPESEGVGGAHLDHVGPVVGQEAGAVGPLLRKA